MAYLDQHLAPGETIRVRGRFHWVQYAWAWAMLVLLGIILIGIFLWAREMIRLSTTEFLVTDRRVMIKQGYANVHVDEVPLGAVESAHVEQSMLGRIFGFGRLTIRGSGDTHVLFPTMADPMAFAAAAQGRPGPDASPAAAIAQPAPAP